MPIPDNNQDDDKVVEVVLIPDNNQHEDEVVEVVPIPDNNQHEDEVIVQERSDEDNDALISEFHKNRCLVNEHIYSYNHFLTFEIERIVKNNSMVNFGVENERAYLRYSNLTVGKPIVQEDGEMIVLNPRDCILLETSYSLPISVDISYCDGVSDPKTYADHVIGRVPCMIKSLKCNLYNTIPEKTGCPLDPGGYFIVKGVEKVVTIQQRHAPNVIYVETEKMGGSIQASVLGSSSDIRTKTILRMKGDKIYLVLSAFTSKLPIMIVFKAMGMVADQQVFQLLGRDTKYGYMLIPSVEECNGLGILNQDQALMFLERRLQRSKYRAGQDGVREALHNVFLPHVPVLEGNFFNKCVYAVTMMRRLMDSISNDNALDDKEYLGYHRMSLAGDVLALLFEDLFIASNKKLKDAVVKRLAQGKGCDIAGELLHVRRMITSTLEYSLSTGNLGVGKYRLNQSGITQNVSRISYIGAYASMTKIHCHTGMSRPGGEPRVLHPSQWGMLCPCDTPAGLDCGLVKHLALLTHVTTAEKEEDIRSVCFTFGVQDINIVYPLSNSFYVLLNGVILGTHTNPKSFVDTMRRLRRHGLVGCFVSIFFHERHRSVYIASDGGRVCRPLVIADNGVSKIKHHHIEELRNGIRNLDSFFSRGLLEYLDVNEENNALIALYEREATHETTHIEIAPYTILGVSAGLIPYPHHNQSPRITYQCAMGKQAMGFFAHNQLCRIDKLTHFLVYPQRPLVTTRTIKLIKYDQLGAGQNAIVAVMSYSGYDIEDAIVMNKSSLDRGFGRCVVMKKMSCTYLNYALFTSGDDVGHRMLSPHDPKKIQILDHDGLVSVGELVRDKDVYLQKEVPVDPKKKETQFRPVKQTYNGEEGELGVVDRVALCSANQRLIVNFMIRHTRRPEVGDKFSSRHGQKGVCGTIVRQEDLPFSERGICPDLVMNPHGFPSRMTVGNMLELIGSKAAAVSGGKLCDGSAFGEPSGHAHDVKMLSETLVEHGFSYSGKDFLYSGETGSPLQAYIFMGPIYYQKLKHMVIDKMRARGIGVRDNITRQPSKGKIHNGGLRVGEMERDALIAHGTSNLIYERLMLSSDPFEGLVCRTCGLIGYFNHHTNTNMCSTCKNGAAMSTVKMPYAFKLLLQELQSMNVVPRLKLESDSRW